MEKEPVRRVAVTGLGLMTSLGPDKESSWARLIEGKSGVRQIERFPTDHLRTTIAATIDMFDTGEILSCARRTRLILNKVVEEAVGEAGTASAIEPSLAFAPVFIAVPGGEATWHDRKDYYHGGNGNGIDRRALQARLREDGLTETVYADLEARYGLLRRPAIVSTACASGATAVQLALDSIRRGETPVALAAAADSTVCAEGLTRFSLLSALSRRNDSPTEASRPFDQNRDGFVMGEGGAALVLEREDHARERGATIIGYVRGCGDATDNFHRTRSDPTGKRISACISRALKDAGVAPEEIGAVNAHGTSTPENDKMEALGLHLALGDALAGIPVTSNKSMIGHTLSAAGLVEVAVSLLSARDSVIPPSINVQEPDESLGLRVATRAERPESLNYVLSNSFGFGGQNVSVVLERP